MPYLMLPDKDPHFFLLSNSTGTGSTILTARHLSILVQGRGEREEEAGGGAAQVPHAGEQHPRLIFCIRCPTINCLCFVYHCTMYIWSIKFIPTKVLQISSTYVVYQISLLTLFPQISFFCVLQPLKLDFFPPRNYSILHLVDNIKVMIKLF